MDRKRWEYIRERLLNYDTLHHFDTRSMIKEIEDDLYITDEDEEE